MTLSLDTITFGEALLLLIADQPGPLEAVENFHKRSAGAETNVAISLARLGLKVGWASRLGNDSMGRFLLATMTREGIDCAKVAFDSAAGTGFMFKGQTTDGSDPLIEYHRKGSAASRMGPADIDTAWLLSARHLHATGGFAAVSATTLAAAQQSMALMRAAGRSVSFDPNLRPTLWAPPGHMRSAINDLAARADWVLPGIDEGRLLTGENSAEDIGVWAADVPSAAQTPMPAFIASAAPAWWSSSWAKKVRTLMAWPVPDSWKAFRSKKSSTPSAPVTDLPSASSAACSTA